MESINKKKEINPMNLKLDSNAEKQIHECHNLIKEIFGQDLLGIYLYGASILEGLQKDSDIDLFIVSNKGITLKEKAKLAGSNLEHRSN